MRIGLIIFVLLFQTQVLAQKTLLVAIKPLTPFVIKSGSGFEGYSIDLWNKVASKNGWQTEYKYFKTVKEVLAAVAAKQVDVGIAGISITKEREKVVDFSLPMFNSGLQVLVPMRPTFNPVSAFRSLFSPQLGFVALMIVSSILIAGHVMWLSMRHRPDYPKGYIKGVTEGIWWAATSFPQNDLGEKNPVSVIGRLAGLFWQAQPRKCTWCKMPSAFKPHPPSKKRFFNSRLDGQTRLSTMPPCCNTKPPIPAMGR
jgi:polar amino acid transport system substrate-binding protein